MVSEDDLHDALDHEIDNQEHAEEEQSRIGMA